MRPINDVQEPDVRSRVILLSLIIRFVSEFSKQIELPSFCNKILWTRRSASSV